jgi:hypothetical protein
LGRVEQARVGLLGGVWGLPVALFRVGVCMVWFGVGRVVGGLVGW